MRTIHHVVDVEAPAKDVWAALTERDQMARWWTTKVAAGPAAPGEDVEWTFAGDFNPVMRITTLDPPHTLGWRCVGGHEPWLDNDFRFELHPLDEAHTRMRFWQEYATELSDDAYGTYNFNWGYYLESLRLLCVTGTGKPYPA